MSDIARYMNDEKLSINDLKLTPKELGELIASIEGGTISGKIGKQVPACFQCCTNIFFTFWSSISSRPEK